MHDSFGAANFYILFFLLSYYMWQLDRVSLLRP